MSIFNRVLVVVSLVIFTLTLNKCGKEPEYCFGPGEVVEPTYEDPIWHPSGSIIGFNHKPLKEVKMSTSDCGTYPSAFIYEEDSVGFWLINENGTNKRRVLSYKLQTPAWSPDGNWIAFVENAQIHRMPFDGENFNISAKEQLTFEGSNFFPAWSSDGRYISFTQSNCSISVNCGVWYLELGSSNGHSLGKYGSYSTWQSNPERILYRRVAYSNDGKIVGDSLWTYSLTTKMNQFFRFYGLPSKDMSHIKYSPSGEWIGFISTFSSGEKGSFLSIVNNEGDLVKKFTHEQVLNFSWSPDDSRILYVTQHWRFHNSDIGVLWIMNSDGSNRKQLTYNHFIRTF